MKESKSIQLCPIHGCEPSFKKHIYVEEGSRKDFNGIIHKFKEQADYYCFCKKCYDEYFVVDKYGFDFPKDIGNTKRDKMIEKFGRGFSSQNSFNVAKNNWNNAVKRFKVTILRKIINGEDLDSKVFDYKK